MISMNLRDIRSPQYEAVTGRKRKVPYQSILTAMGPSIRENARQEDLDALREKEITDAQTRFNTEMGFNREKMGIEQDQAAKSMLIQGATLVPTAAYVADKAGLISLKGLGAAAKAKLFGTAAPAALPEAAAAGSQAAYLGLEAAGAGTAAAFTPAELGLATSGASFTGGVGAGAIEGATATGAVAADVTGATATTGAVDLSLAPYALPVVAGYVGSQAGGYAGQKVGEALDVGGNRERTFVGKVGGGAAAGFAVGGPVGAGIGATVGLVDWSVNEGGHMFRSAYNDTLGRITGDTWICTAIDEAVGLSEEDKERLSRLRRWALKNHNGWTRRYLKDGGVIVAGMEKRFRIGIRPIYEILKVSFVAPVTAMVERGRFEAAYEIYFSITEALAREYAPEFEIWELPNGNDETESGTDFKSVPWYENGGQISNPTPAGGGES